MKLKDSIIDRSDRQRPINSAHTTDIPSGFRNTNRKIRARTSEDYVNSWVSYSETGVVYVVNVTRYAWPRKRKYPNRK
jgi:uncharacterized protein YbaA (DUF1428 family)